MNKPRDTWGEPGFCMKCGAVIENWTPGKAICESCHPSRAINRPRSELCLPLTCPKLNKANQQVELLVKLLERLGLLIQSKSDLEVLFESYSSLIEFRTEMQAAIDSVRSFPAKEALHLIPSGANWILRQAGREDSIKTFDNFYDAYSFARALAAEEKTGLLIHGVDGSVLVQDTSQLESE